MTPATPPGPPSSRPDLRVALLGPFEVWRDALPISLGSNRLRALLATLAMSVGETVSVERLARNLWPQEFPANPRRGVQTYVVRLRRALGAGAIRTMPDGYRLEVEPDRVDALRLRRLLAAVSRSRGAAGERETLEYALTLWRGMPFEGVDCSPLRDSTDAQLVELRLAAVERWIDLGLAEGLHGELVAEVRTLAACHPLREPLRERLLVTLHRCGHAGAADPLRTGGRVRLLPYGAGRQAHAAGPRRRGGHWHYRDHRGRSRPPKHAQRPRAASRHDHPTADHFVPVLTMPDRCCGGVLPGLAYGWSGGSGC